MNSPLDLKIRSSRWLSLYTVTLYALAAFAITMLGLPDWFKWVLAVSLILIALHGWLRRHQICGLTVAADGSAHIRYNNGTRARLMAIRPRVVVPLLIILDLTLVADGPIRLVLLPDSASKHQLRLLRLVMHKTVIGRDEEYSCPE